MITCGENRWKWAEDDISGGRIGESGVNMTPVRRRTWDESELNLTPAGCRTAGEVNMTSVRRRTGDSELKMTSMGGEHVVKVRWTWYRMMQNMWWEWGEHHISRERMTEQWGGEHVITRVMNIVHQSHEHLRMWSRRAADRQDPLTACPCLCWRLSQTTDVTWVSVLVVSIPPRPPGEGAWWPGLTNQDSTSYNLVSKLGFPVVCLPGAGAIAGPSSYRLLSFFSFSITLSFSSYGTSLPLPLSSSSLPFPHTLFSFLSFPNLLTPFPQCPPVLLLIIYNTQDVLASLFFFRRCTDLVFVFVFL